ncbi:hypothetical protein, partial [Neisseria sicca]|uniref:hypothetical protein n=1 Tax=Neisseria sicca TaxID=490 RepID=UPI003F68B2F6
DLGSDGGFVGVKVFGDLGDGGVGGEVLDMVWLVLGELCVGDGNVCWRKGGMVGDSGVFVLGKVGVEMGMGGGVEKQKGF